MANKVVKVFEHFVGLDATEAIQVFQGRIQDKSYNGSDVRFKVKNFVYEIRRPVNLPLFTIADGTISDSVLGTPKRRLYGEVEGVQMQSVDQTLDGFTLTGTITGAIDTNIITGTATDFLDEVNPGDSIKITLDLDEFNFTIESVDSDTQLTLGSTLDVSFALETATNLPIIPYRRQNRIFNLAHHKLREPSTAITEIIQANRVVVASVADLFADDPVTINAERVRIKVKTCASDVPTMFPVVP